MLVTRSVQEPVALVNKLQFNALTPGLEIKKNQTYLWTASLRENSVPRK